MDPFSLTAGIAGIAGLAGLFSTCLDVIDKVDSYKDFGFESRSIITQFEADKLLFQKWAQNVGINKPKLEDHHSGLDDPQTASMVQTILSSIQEIFARTDSTLSNLQPIAKTGSKSSLDSVLFHRGHAQCQKLESSTSKRTMIVWALRRKAKFIAQVQQFGALVQRLHILVPLRGTSKASNAHNEAIGGVLDVLSSIPCLMLIVE